MASMTILRAPEYVQEGKNFSVRVKIEWGMLVPKPESYFKILWEGAEIHKTGVISHGDSPAIIELTDVPVPELAVPGETLNLSVVWKDKDVIFHDTLSTQSFTADVLNESDFDEALEDEELVDDEAGTNTGIDYDPESGETVAATQFSDALAKYAKWIAMIVILVALAAMYVLQAFSPIVLLLVIIFAVIGWYYAGTKPYVSAGLFILAAASPILVHYLGLSDAVSGVEEVLF